MEKTFTFDGYCSVVRMRDISFLHCILYLKVFELNVGDFLCSAVFKEAEQLVSA